MHCDCGDKSEYFDFEVWQKKNRYVNKKYICEKTQMKSDESTKP